MSELPTGTVTLLFSDIEGSTALLKRLGAAYEEALRGQRTVLRKAWADHGGTELGTEGDSFYVVFPTAEGAVAAATQAQRELAGFEWPAGEQVRVRMGIHTGAPTPHDGAYVGMDVHRAARVAGAAHGGQVLVSEATSKLTAECLPEQVTLKDLGSHQLKDITSPEHLFQLAIGGLRSDFPPPKTLGASSSLPRPATPLVGRDGEAAELAAVLGSPEVRLVTLTGPGGSGKTRLAIGVAQGLVERFPDGVYFVDLAAATSSDVMWTTIADALDVPPEGRIPPAFFTHVAHRSALLVLDNLEQVQGADVVVDELLLEAPQVVVLATSRRPLRVPAEHEHAVPPLELPEDTDRDDVARSGAVQLFVQHARKVRSGFLLSHENYRDVAEVCRRLDGLPLAIELAAARSKLLSPHALLARLDTALDLKASGVGRPTRQQTLRDTIAWSYDLLTPTQQWFFRRLGVFAGGADLAAIETVSNDDFAGEDPLDLAAELVDASLVTVAETPEGEPWIGMLVTVRAYATDQLAATGEREESQERHAHYYLHLAEERQPELESQQFLGARNWFETEHDNLREALAWALAPPSASASEGRVWVGLRLIRALAGFWSTSGYFSEGRRWLEQGIDRAGGNDSLELADCLGWLSRFLEFSGDLDQAFSAVSEAVSVSRRLPEPGLAAKGLGRLARLEQLRGRPAVARSRYEEAVMLGESAGDKEALGHVLLHFALLETSEHNYQRSLDLDAEALALARELGNHASALTCQHNKACTLRQMGRVEDAKQAMRDLIPGILELSDATSLIAVAEDYAAVLAELGDHQPAVRLLGAADAMRHRLGARRDPAQEVELAQPIARTREALTGQDWDDGYQAGRTTTVEAALTQALAAT